LILCWLSCQIKSYNLDSLIAWKDRLYNIW